MTRLLRPKVAFALAALAIALFAGCGGGDGSDSGSDANRWEALPVADYPYPVQMLPNEAPSAEGRHFAEGEFTGYNTVQYGTDPPTSGRHIGQLVEAGVYDQPIPSEIAVHQMEHGYSIVWYNCNDDPPLDAAQCTELRTALAAVVQPAAAQGRHVVMTPDTTMAYRIAITAWQFMDTMPNADEERVGAFIDTFECHYDPEGGCA